MGNEEVQALLCQLRTALSTGAPTPAVMELLNRLEPAVGELIGECASLRSRLERPLSSGLRRGSPEQVEAWVRKLERPETTAQ